MRLTMLYGSEYWVVDKRIEQQMSVTEIRMIRWMNKMKRDDGIGNEYVRSIGVALENVQNEIKQTEII